MLDREYIIAADLVRRKVERHVLFRFIRIVEALHLVEQFFAALGALNRFFPVKGAEFLNHSFLVLDLRLLVFIGAGGGFGERFLLLGELRVIAVVACHLAVV